MNTELIKEYKQKAEKELLEDILPFWKKYSVDNEYGGFTGYLTNNLMLHRDAPKGLVLCSRILWSFSKTYRELRDKESLGLAERAYHYMVDKFIDAEYGGFNWKVDFKGNCIDSTKQTYGQAYALYGLSEYYMASGNADVLSLAIELFNQIEKNCYDVERGGYFESFTREWQYCHEHKITPKGITTDKSMNTQLHIIEAYTNLLRVYNNDTLRLKLKEAIINTIEHVIDPGMHLIEYMDKSWNRTDYKISYGHDIEGSWLLYEAAEVLGEKSILSKVREIAINMAKTAYNEGLDSDGGMFYEGSPQGITKPHKDWWPQAEAAVGFINAWQLTGEDLYLKAFFKIWDFIELYIVDRKYGEWYFTSSKDGGDKDEKLKIWEWKCPYHNIRACFEIMKRLS